MNKHPKFSLSFVSKRLLAALAVSGCLLTGLQALTWAGSNPGLTIFSGVDNRNNILDYHLDFGGRPENVGERYKLYVPGKKLTQGVSKFYISYLEKPEFNGKFDLDSVQIRIKGKTVPIREVYWDKESRVIEIDLAENIEASQKVDIVFSNVKNPSSGTYYFICDVLSSGNIPVRLYVGTWILSIEKG
ncbi:DUF2808 domain-containing protein [Aphanothece sacrum]|uniref:DUF2808 domain-containing protein n=1 Tax=Aphanothece sacrum FPU1 TaxID=1920663 RepID=A0A401IMH7_APHSA|nr:DUF2808 domain-containing protein [Aphanothece sacrum]GBF82470.1 hypothetical protein AsFPU1_3899 [Aphanothece sacrum FPU1]GBF84375.1 hypothetical protein AsFPU3_1424 [Aphanothece sacrum FPU3]